MIFMPDYMESHVSALGLPRVLKDLRNVVIMMAENWHENKEYSAKLWLFEQDLSQAIHDFAEDDNGVS